MGTIKRKDDSIRVNTTTFIHFFKESFILLKQTKKWSVLYAFITTSFYQSITDTTDINTVFLLVILIN
ncbi:hypothetical protein KSF78_0009174 [Schistosoma japonicum]|nr:hypothetical protein KSF78_0009174 [Schistosoma japonicum]